MAETSPLESYAVKSYRYLRLSMVVVLLSLAASVLIERSHVSCWQGSVSAYYYTPVQAMFVTALVVIGVSLIAVKGVPDLEDVLLNFAGVLAPIVAFVPTSAPPPSQMCSSAAVVARNNEPFIDNNIVAFAIGGVVAIAIAFVIAFVFARRTGRATVGHLDRESFLGLAAALLVLVVGIVWYIGFRESFLERAHGGGAALMFFVLFLVIVHHARQRRRTGKSWLLYGLIAGTMALSVVGALVGKAVDDGWRHQILWLEVLELGAVLVYWVAQTFEHWDGGVTKEV